MSVARAPQWAALVHSLHSRQAVAAVLAGCAASARSRQIASSCTSRQGACSSSGGGSGGRRHQRRRQRLHLASAAADDSSSSSGSGSSSSDGSPALPTGGTPQAVADWAALGFRQAAATNVTKACLLLALEEEAAAQAAYAEAEGFDPGSDDPALRG